MKTGGRGKAPGRRGATTDRAENKKRDKGSREKETGEGSEKASRGRETTKKESREADESRGGVAEAKRGR